MLLRTCNLTEFEPVGVHHQPKFLVSHASKAMKSSTRGDVELTSLPDPALERPEFATPDAGVSSIAGLMHTALASAEADLATFDAAMVLPAGSGASGFKRDRRATSVMKRLWGRGWQFMLGQTPCRVAKLSSIYSVGFSLEELGLLRMQTLAVPLVLAGMVPPVLLRLSGKPYPEEWIEPLPVNGMIGLLVILINLFLTSIWHAIGIPKRCGRLGALNTLAAVRGYHIMVSYDVDGTKRAHSLASVLSQSGRACLRGPRTAARALVLHARPITLTPHALRVAQSTSGSTRTGWRTRST